MKLRLGGPPRPPKSCCLANHSPRAQALIRASPSPIQACVEPASRLRAGVPSAQCALCVASLPGQMRAFGVQDCPPQRLVRKTPRYYRSIRRHHRSPPPACAPIDPIASHRARHVHHPPLAPFTSVNFRLDSSPVDTLAVAVTVAHPPAPHLTFGPTTTRVALCSAGTRGLSSSPSHPPPDRHRPAHRPPAVPASPRTSLLAPPQLHPVQGATRMVQNGSLSSN